MIIAARNLSRIFRTKEVETTALDSISLEVREGEFVALMGPSGCGKSTVMHILGLIDSVSTGSYQFLGQEVATLSARERTRVRKAQSGAAALLKGRVCGADGMRSKKHAADRAFFRRSPSHGLSRRFMYCGNRKPCADCGAINARARAFRMRRKPDL